jgi:hypothetical protein
VSSDVRSTATRSTSAFRLLQRVLDGPLDLLPLHLQVLEAEDPQADGGVHRVLDPPGDVIGLWPRHPAEAS